MSPTSVTLLAALASSDPLEATEAVEHRTDSSDCCLAHHQAVRVAAAAGATAGSLPERNARPGDHTQAVWAGAADATADIAGDLQERGRQPGQTPAVEMTLAAGHQGAALRSSQQDWQIIGKFCSLTVPEAWLRGVVRAWRRTAWTLQHGRQLQQVQLACTGPWCAAWRLGSSSVQSQWCLSCAALFRQGCLSRLHMLGAGVQTGCCCCVPVQGSLALSSVAHSSLLSGMLQKLAARQLRRVLKGWRHAIVTQARRLHLLSTTLAEQHDLGVLERALHIWQHVRTVTTYDVDKVWSC